MRDSSLKKKIIKTIAVFKRIGLKNRNYTIISNNCWGGVMTRNYGLQYNSPTCGCYFYSKEYLKFCADLKASIGAELIEVRPGESKYADDLFRRYNGNVVVGKVLDAEVVLLHYNSFAEAKAKWDRRKARVNWDNLIVKFNDQNLFELEDYYAFENLPYKNKLFFTANKQLKENKNVIYFDEYENKGYVVDDIKSSKRYFNLKKYLNNLN